LFLAGAQQHLLRARLIAMSWRQQDMLEMQWLDGAPQQGNQLEAFCQPHNPFYEREANNSKLPNPTITDIKYVS
jgi:hypothetical protein